MSMFDVGAIVQVIAVPPFLKTADTMPMLRPAESIRVGEQGRIVDRRPINTYGVRFASGTFLLDSKYLALADDT
ncbi:MAG: DUF3148 domain-containing protein [Cyanobacteria bacterium P01_F01_bin.33]